MKLLRLVNRNANLEEHKCIFYTKGFCTISERAEARTLLNHFHSLTHSEQVRYLSSQEHKSKIFKADRLVR
jgi:hypothetical protein